MSKQETEWMPACNMDAIRLRAEMLASIRLFFHQKAILEVETPLLCHATGTDPQLNFFSSTYHCHPHDKTLYLQTSPEFAMKRMLAAGSGSIFQICKAFRNSELGRHHNPEFSILEWYRVDYNLQQLIEETLALLLTILGQTYSAESTYQISYVDCFKQSTQIDPLDFCLEKYSAYAKKNGMHDAINLCGKDHALWLDLIFSYKVQPTLAKHGIAIVYGYPAIQASLARINQENPNIADRFEVFINGIEIGNGFFELADATEQEKRFDQENQYREKNGLEQINKDQYFLNALKSGLPSCSGIAIGLDRLLMVITNAQSLHDVIAFPFERA